MTLTLPAAGPGEGATRHAWLLGKCWAAVGIAQCGKPVDEDPDALGLCRVHYEEMREGR